MDEYKNIELINVTEQIVKHLDFKTHESTSIHENLLHYVLKDFDRMEGIITLSKYFPYKIAKKINTSILESTLIYVSAKNYVDDMVDCIYNQKLQSFINNIDDTNNMIENNNLYDTLINENIDPSYIGFMKPWQLNYDQWKDIQSKINKKEEISSQIKVTDIYTCYKCKSKKCTTTQIQTRCADEPMTIFVTCLVCHNTFTK
jgi:transcription elongation factor S-II